MSLDEGSGAMYISCIWHLEALECMRITPEVAWRRSIVHIPILHYDSWMR